MALKHYTFQYILSQGGKREGGIGTKRLVPEFFLLMF